MKRRANVSSLLSNFFKNGKKIYYKESETIIPRETEKPKYVYFLHYGYVHQYTLGRSKTINMNIFKPNSYFPMINIFAKFPNKYSYEAMTNVEVYAVPRAKFMVFVRDNPEVMFDLAARLSLSLDMMSQVIESIMSFDSSEKVIRILLMCVSRFGIKHGNNVIISVPLTHSDIANMIGISRETVTRELGELVRLKLIKKIGGRYVLTKLATLRRMLHD